MSEKQSMTMFQNASSYLFLKTQLADFAKKQMERYHSLNYLADQFAHKQKLKVNFNPQEYLKSIQSISAQLEIYFTDMVVKLTSFPLLADLAKILDKVMSEYSKVLSHSQDYWMGQIRTLKRSMDGQSKVSPVMEMCLNCSENVRQQEIKQAKTRLYNPVCDPFQLYQANAPTKVVVFEQTRQKELQDKLSQLASNAQFGQMCIQQMIQSSEQHQLREELLISKEAEGARLQFLPLVKSVYQKIKGQKKQFYDFGVQASLQKKVKVEKSQRFEVQVGLKTQKEGLSKRQSQCQTEDKSKQVKELEEKVKELEKQKYLMTNEINVLKNMNLVLQEKNSGLELQIAILQAEKSKSMVKVANTKPIPKKIDENPAEEISSPTPQQAEKNIYQRKRKSHRTEARFRKGELISNIPASLLNLTRSGALNSHNSRNSRNSNGGSGGNTSSGVYSGSGVYGGNESRQHKRRATKNKTKNASKLHRHTDMIHENKQDTSHSEDSCMKVDDIDEESDIEVISKPLTNKKSMESSQPTKKTVVEGSNVKTYTKLSNFREKVSFDQKRRIKDMVQAAEQRSSSHSEKGRRVGAFYNRDQILRIIYEEQVRGCDNPLSFQAFREACDSFLSRAVSRNLQKRADFKDEFKENFEAKSGSQDKMRIKHLQKKSATSLKQRLRGDLVRSKLTSQKRNDKKNIMKSNFTSHHNTSSFGELPSIQERDINQLGYLHSLEQREISNFESIELPKLINKLLLESLSDKKDKKVLLQNNEHHMMTQIMAYLAQLKSKSRNNYQAMRKLLSSFDKKHGKNNKDALQHNITQIIAMHRTCQRSQSNLFCEHLKELVGSITRLID